MNTFKTMLLLAALTALLMVVGYTIGGPQGMILALAVAAVTNLLTWWKLDQMVLKMHKARPLAPREGRIPMWLASALIKISNTSMMPVTAERFSATAPLFIRNPLKMRSTDSVFSTHPNVRNRVAELQELAREMGQKAMTLPNIQPIQSRSPWGRQRDESHADGARRPALWR